LVQPHVGLDEGVLVAGTAFRTPLYYEVDDVFGVRFLSKRGIRSEWGSLPGNILLLRYIMHITGVITSRPLWRGLIRGLYLVPLPTPHGSILSLSALSDLLDDQLLRMLQSGLLSGISCNILLLRYIMHITWLIGIVPSWRAP